MRAGLLGHGHAARRAVVVAFVLLFAGVMAGEYVVFRHGLEAAATVGTGAALTLYLLEAVLVLIFLLALSSFAASGLWLYFRARDTRFLLAAPIPAGAVFALRTIETFALTSWSLVVVGVPALLALGATFGHGPWFYVRGSAVLATVAVLTIGAGALLTTAAGAALRRVSSRLAVGLTLAAVLAAFTLVVGRNLVPSVADFTEVFSPGMANGKPGSITFIESKFALWPTHPAAAALYTSATGGHAGSATTRLAVWLVPLAALAAAATLGRRLYVRTLPAAFETFSVGRAGGPARAPARPFPRRLRGPIGALVERDVLAIGRSPHELGRAAFLGVLLLLYTSFVAVAPLRHVGDRPEAVALLLLFTVVAGGYFATAVGLRFTYPATSLEGRAAWVFFSSPLPVFRLLLARAALHAGLLAVIVVPVAMLGVVRLSGDPAVVAAAAVLLLAAVGTVATLLLAAGAAWPNFRETDPDTLSTSGGGLAATVGCLAYVAAVGWAAHGAALAAAAGGSVVPWLAAALAGSAALGAGALALARRCVQDLEGP